MKLKYMLISLGLFFSTPVLADQISADRPGVGSSPEIVDPLVIQAEVGNDSKNIRLGIAKNFEINKDQDSVGAKYKFLNRGNFEAAVKVSYANDSTFIVELPTQLTLNKYLSVSTDVILASESKTYVGNINLAPTSNFTISNSVYYDDKIRYGIFAAWVPPKAKNLQFDIGYVGGKVTAGVSWMIRLHH